MNQQTKQICKKIIYPIWDVLDATISPLSRWLTFLFCRFRDINDLDIIDGEQYEPLGHYVTLYKKPPAYYQRFLNTYHYDEDGIPQQQRYGTYHYNGVMIAQYGLMEYGYYLSTKNPNHRQTCIKMAQKLLQLQDEQGGWPYRFDYNHPSAGDTLSSGWYSAMAQGQAISLFVRANALQPDPHYRQAAEKSMSLFKIPVEDGGIYRKWNGLELLEEYPTKKPSCTLNGMIFSMIGLYDGSQYFHLEEAGMLFDSLCNTVACILPLYDDRYISSYDLTHVTNAPRDKVRDRKYHILHVRLLQALNYLAPNEVYQYYINKWKKTI